MIAQARADFLQRCRQLQYRSYGRQCFGNVVVAVHSGDFFDYIDFKLKVMSIRRDADDKVFAVTASIKFEAEQEGFDLGRSQVDSNNAIGSLRANSYLTKNFRFWIAVGKTFDRFALCYFLKQPGSFIESYRNVIYIGAALEAVRRVRHHTESFSGFADCCRVKEGSFEKHA